MKALKTRILSLRMDQDDILDIHKWVLCRFQEDGTVSVEIDREAMRADGYTITESNPYQQLFGHRDVLAAQQAQMGPFEQQRMEAARMGRNPGSFASILGSGII